MYVLDWTIRAIRGEALGNLAGVADDNWQHTGETLSTTQPRENVETNNYTSLLT